MFTDRPNVTDAVNTLSAGTFQIEAGYLYQSFSSSTNFTTYPNLSFKYGIVDWFELRLLTNYQRFEQNLDGANSEVSGFSPLTISPKIKLTEQTTWVPKFSLATSFTFPDIGEEAFQNDKLNYGFRLLLENENGLPWSGGFGSDWGDSGETTWAYSWTTGASLSEKVGFFVEIYGYFANDIDSQHSVDGGFTYLVNNNLQADIIAGFPLNKFAPDFIFGFGLAWKTHFKN
ncbi:transporter [Fulvivirga sp. RKSG066]|nr:transporter [Fulvivirga aurantia]